MSTPSLTVVIRTINRPTLHNAIDSAKRENLPVIVISDGIDIDQKIVENTKYQCLGKRYGNYGSMAMNVGMLLCETEFGLTLDDDDELIVGAGDIVKKKLFSDPSIDIWIPTVLYEDGTQACYKGEVEPGNIAVPIFRCSVFTEVPMTHHMSEADPAYTDFHHVNCCHARGYKVDWINEVTYLVRPRLIGDCGAGE